jgi:hypothetical protein
MKAETVQKAFEIVEKIKSISINIEIMVRGHGDLNPFTDIPLHLAYTEMRARHRQEVMEIFRIRKDELEKELAAL